MMIDRAREVRALAQEVIQLIDAAEARAKSDRASENEWRVSRGLEPWSPISDIGGTRESGALRRRSMDLTRALAAMRRS